MCKNEIKNLHFITRYENGGTSESVPDCYKIKNNMIKLLINTLMHKNLLLSAIRLKKCVMKLPILIIL